MPLLKVHIAGPPDASQSEIVARELTSLTQRHLHKDPALTAVAITKCSPDDWFIGAQSLAAQGLSSFALEIKVTSGTNTKVEMASYIEGVFETMSSLLGPLHATSYVVVQDVAAAAWGYAGKTQEFRFVEGRIKATA